MVQNSGHHVFRALTFVIYAITLGTLGFWFVSPPQVSFGDCLYMTIITLSTVGYGEIIPMNDLARVVASLLIIFGMGSLIYFGSTVIAFFIDLDLQKVRRRKRMQKLIDDLKNHIIVCGIGTTGTHVVRELIAAKADFVMIEKREERIKEFSLLLDTAKENLPFILGDATEDRVLEMAGLAKAHGLVAALPSDKDNIYIILSAKQANPNVRIVSRAIEKDASSKMMHAGADSVVSPNLIGGLRIASEMLRPQVVEFLDMMLRDQDKNTRIEQISLPEDSPLVGKRLKDTNIRKATDILVIALRDQLGKYIYNPGPDTILTPKATLVVLGSFDAIIHLRTSVTEGFQSISQINSP